MIMKKAILTMVLALIAGTVFSTIWHVNNVPTMNANYSSLATACSSASVAAGDTLYIYGSPTTYESVTISKRLTLIGPGYYLGENPGLQSNPVPASVNTINFSTGSNGSLISGMSILSYIQVDAPNIVVQRNKMPRLFINNDNCIAIQNFLINPPGGNHTINANSAANYVIANNYIANSVNGWCFLSEATSGGVFINNIVTGSSRFFNAEVYNCIIGFTGSGTSLSFESDVNTTFHHNVFRSVSSWDWTTSVDVQGEGNLYNVTGELYVATGSPDGYYQLCTGSAALGAGISGQDCGIYGGQEPYRLSGIPAIPTIYEFYAPATGFIIPIQLKARSND